MRAAGGRGGAREANGAVRLHAIVRGQVQGVGYRYFVLARARTAGLRGWVRNRSDGSVECVAEGARRPVERLLDELREGPRAAEVEAIDADWLPATGDLSEFDVTY